MSKTNEHSGDVDVVNEFRKRLLRFRLEMSEQLIDVTERIKAEVHRRPDLCDIGWACREAAKVADDIRKEFNARFELAGKLLAFRITQDAIQNPELLTEKDGLVARGRFASGTPDVSQAANPPKHGTKEYLALGRYLGIPDPVLESSVVRFSYPDLAEMISRSIEEGKPLPDGIRDTRPVYRTTFRTLTSKKRKN